MMFFKKKGYGEIVRKNHIKTSDFRFWTYNKKLKKMVSVCKTMPNMWYLHIKIGNRVDFISVTESEYNNHNVGEIVSITYKRGLLYNNIYNIN